MLVNLFDANFRQSICSVAYQAPQYIEYVRDQMCFDGVTLFTDAYINDPIVDQVQSRYKIAWLHEPYCLHPDIYEAALDNVHKFDCVLTYHQPYLDRGHPFRFAPYGGAWIDRRDWGIKLKSKLCSMLIGDKTSTEGHRLRHEIADMIEREGYPVDFYGVRGTPVGYGQDTKLRVLSDYCFSIVTETCREDNLFTEWLLDCFAVGTVPIYWGCPNYHNFFDYRGMFIFSNFRELHRVLKGLNHISIELFSGDHRITPELYRGTVAYLYNNLTWMQPYAITEDWLYLNVLKGHE